MVSTTSESALCYMTASEAIAKFKSRKLSPVDLMKAVIERAETVNPKVNAFTYTFYERALKQAKRAERAYASRGKTPRPLEGIPTAIKDFHPVKDEITTYGSKTRENFRPSFSAPTVERLLEAGGIMHCRTTTPEFAHSGATRSLLWGVTRNPWNLEYGPGGSSGGAGAAVATGMTTVADGTDGGGSIRIPASACGVFGYKPPFGRNPLDRDLPLESFLHYGPITRCVADAALMQNVMSGPHPDDITSLREKMVLPKKFEPIKGWKIALSMKLGYFEVAPEVQKNTRDAAAVFKGLGCRVEEVEIGWTSPSADAFLTHWQTLCATVCADLLPQWRDQMDPFLVKITEEGMRYDSASDYRGNFVRGQMYRSLAPILAKFDVLICPTLAVASVKAEHQNDQPDFRINGKEVSPWIGWILTYPFNMLSQCPVASVPSGFSSFGVPTGLQIVGKSFDDLSVFRAASAYESARPWCRYRPKL